MQLGGFDPPLAKRVLCARQTAGLYTAQYGALVDAACRCGFAQAVAHGGAPRRFLVRGNGAALWLKVRKRCCQKRPHRVDVTTPAAWRYSPRSAASLVSNLDVQFSAKLLDKGASRRRVGKAPPKIDLGFFYNSSSVPHLNVSRFMKMQHPAA